MRLPPWNHAAPPSASAPTTSDRVSRSARPNASPCANVCAVADLGIKGDGRDGLAHFAVDFEQGGLGDVKSDDTGGVETCDLAAEFGADGAGGAGDEDGFA